MLQPGVFRCLRPLFGERVPHGFVDLAIVPQQQSVQPILRITAGLQHGLGHAAKIVVERFLGRVPTRNRRLALLVSEDHRGERSASVLPQLDAGGDQYLVQAPTAPERFRQPTQPLEHLLIIRG
jgi:hypothetical protein